ncbi:1-alkyl-2-acetylglycerophosphocholine esterase [Rhodotorula toruloides]|uniref:Putative phospholipase n=1 Tax=Rhodotorula toruloides TaxID=5286 RepID=A0A511K781_RHOTO|nr:1-alkyl-2-acetylglycerophosphocholine esterase [Rhodotorula toruloides]
MGLIVNSLPKYSGPYPVATADLELAVAAPRSFGHALLKSTKQPALQLDTVLVTLFYPADSTQRGSGKRQHWLQRPLGQTAEGYARFLGQKSWLVKALFWLVGAGVRLSVQADRPLAPKKTVEPATSEGCSAAASHDTVVNGALAGGQDRFPLVVFSHGLSGTRTTYSQWCGEIASRGYIVAAIEHRDGSGPVSVVRSGDGKERIVDYIRPEHLEWPSGHPPQSTMQFRSSQLSMRLAEISSVLSLMQRLSNGDGAAVARENRRKEYGEGKTLEGWKGRIDLEKEVTMAGHSFGGATTIQVLRAGATQSPFKRGIALDPWADPIPPAPSPSSPSFSPLSASVSTNTTGSNPAPTTSPSNGNGGKVPLDINVPLLVINSEAFTLWRQHYSLVRDIVKAVEGGAERWLMTLIGSIHISFSDLPLLLPSYLNPRAGSRIPARLATSRVVEACGEFLSGQATSGEILGQRVKDGDENGARDGEGGKDAEGNKRVMKGEVGSMRMHIAGKA